MPGPPVSGLGQFGAAAPGPQVAWQNYQKGAQYAPPTQIQVPRAYEGRRPRWGDSFRPQELEQIDWKGRHITPATKNFLTEMHPSTMARTPEECEKIRMEHSIHVINNSDDDEVPKPIVNLEEVAFPDHIYRVLQDKGFSKPTSIQVQAWPVALSGHDLVGIAETGSGKTLAYVPPMLVHVTAQPELRPHEGPVAIIMVPNRELCEQVQQEIEAFTTAEKDLKDVHVQAVHGGGGYAEQAAAFLGVCDIVVATPNRLIHLLNDKRLNLLRTTFLVLDEADELLSMGFEQQIRLVLSQIRPDRQVCLFSATWPDEVDRLAKEVCSYRPIHLNVGSIKLAACKTIEQTFRLVGNEPGKIEPHRLGLSKLENLDVSLKDLADEFRRGAKALVFCNKVETVHEVVTFLQDRNHRCEAFSSLVPQAERHERLRTFRSENCPFQFLVSTKVLGRGHDFPRLGFVINYDMPTTMVEYVHRIGRTGRAGEEGRSLTLLEPTDLWMAKKLVDCLNETSQDIPRWLQDASTNKKRKEYERLYYAKKNGTLQALQDSEATGARAQSDWKGRGRGTRHIFLQELGGTGAAREVQP
uniref:RNA helicase n=1 Tax=Alexandrium monilatum TaxID=311494 RepID=A0A7S4W2N4_9DINO